LASFFPGFPRDLEAYRRKVADVDARFDPERRRLMAGAIRATSPGAAARLEEIVAGNGLFVTTGQQPGLFTGPLYTVHKILCAVQLARSLEAALGRPVAPLFWVASDDHDWEEANHIYVLDRQHQPRRIVLGGGDAAPAASMRRRLLGPEIEPVLDEFCSYLPTTEFAAELLQLLRECYRPERTVAEAFTEAIAHLFAPFDLLLVDGGQPLVKELSSELMERELVDAAAHEALFAAQTRRLEEAGYRGQVPVLPGATNLHYEDDEGRDRLVRAGDRFVLRRSGRSFGRAELLARLRAEPARFSANVVLRPIIESAVFPTISYVGGPGEVSYFAQYGDLFRAHGIGAPVVFPRFSVLMIEAKVRRILDRFGLEPGAFRSPFHELSTRVIRDEVPGEVREATTALRCSIEEGYRRLEAAALRIDPMLAGPLATGRNGSIVRLAEVEKRIVRHLKRQSGIELDQLARAGANLFPADQPQERVLNIFPYLVRYGQEILPALAGGMHVSFK
jgi:bacillithiol biosynthesis cysteine-adding enzyme BshC